MFYKCFKIIIFTSVKRCWQFTLAALYKSFFIIIIIIIIMV
jgi:hypothetical protein